MTISSKIMLVFVTLTAIVFFYMAARTLQTHAHLRQVTNAFEDKVALAEKEREALLYGVIEGEGDEARVIKRGLQQARLEQKKLALRRGRVWANCPVVLKPIDPATMEVTVKIESPPNPSPHMLQVGNVVYVFDDRPLSEGGQFLGEFKVTVAPDNATEVTLAPTFKLNPTRERAKAELLKRLTASGQPNVTWSLYEVLPQDQHGVFASLTEADLDNLLPPQVVDEYKRDGKPAEADDPDERVTKDANGKRVYSRPLQDWQTLMVHADKEQTYLLDRIEGLKRDLAGLNKAVEAAKLDNAAREKELAQLKADTEISKAELAAVEEHQANVQAAVDASVKEIAETFAKNKELAAEIAKLHAQAIERANKALEAGRSARVEPAVLTESR